MIKQIINWTLGGFFRSLGKFLLFLCIGILIALIFAKNDIKLPFMTIVHASETSGYGTAKYIDCSYPIDNRGLVDTTQSRCIDWYNFGTEDTYPNSNYRYMYSNNVFITSGNYTYEKGNRYTITMTLAINPKDYDDFNQSFRVGQYRFEGGTTSQTSSLSASNLVYDSSSLELSNISNNTYWVQLKFNFVPTTSLKSVWFQILYRDIADGGEASGRGLALRDFQYYRIDSVTYVEGNDLTQITDAINTQIENDNNNTQSIINNQNQNTQDIINSNLVCKNYNKDYIEITGKALGNTGNPYNSDSSGISQYIDISKVSHIKVLEFYNSASGLCFYQTNKTLISCVSNNSLSNGQLLTIPNGAYYLRYTINIAQDRPILSICYNGSQALQDTLNDTDTSDSESDALDFFNDFNSDSDSLISDLVTLPLTFLQSLVVGDTNDLCTTWHGKNICFPNGQRILWQKNYDSCNSGFGCNSSTIVLFKTFFNVVAGGYLAYKLIKDAIHTVHNWLEPDKSTVEVMQL